MRLTGIDMRAEKQRSRVAVVVPVYEQRLLPDEELAVRLLQRNLNSYDRYQVSPASLDFQLPEFELRKFNDAWFESVESYSKLMLSKCFYESFAAYEFILIYQLDCLVFSDQLEHWCRQGLDYIGAPLFNIKGQPESGFSGACNGGLSLRKVDSFLKVLNSPRYTQGRASFLTDVFHRPFIDVGPLPLVKRWRKRIQVAREVRHGVKQYAASYTLNEDHFWSGRASYFYPGFRVAPPKVALAFAFEAAPDYCFECTGRKLPFGAHAWQKWNRVFWERHLLKH